jgi:flagellar biosynthesis anti-sigma factor FlgM
MIVSDKQLMAVLRASERRTSAAEPAERPGPVRDGAHASRSTLVRDDITLSSRAREVMKLRRVLNGMPPVREEKLARIKERVARGTYHVPLEEVAEKIITRGAVNRLVAETDR